MEYIAVIDVGKTNKKVLVFDNRLRIVDSAYRAFEETVEGRLHVEDLAAMSQWMKQQLKVFTTQYDIRALSITTHGATAVCIGSNGEPVVPAVAYTTEVDPDFGEEFYGKFGNRNDLQVQTATAEVGMLVNAAKKVYYIQQRWPENFQKVTNILFLPQYLGYLFTGKTGAEPTMLGCHTYLYDFVNRTYSPLVDAMGIRRLLPPTIARSWEVLGTVTAEVSGETGLAQDCLVTMGIHDSNSSLLPYLVKGFDNFVLNSTGTWCVAMHPTEKVFFNKDEIGKMVFYNMDAFFHPVKTSIFMGGLEFETYSKLLAERCGRSDFPGFDYERYQSIFNERRLFILPSVTAGAGLFPDSVPRVVEDGKVFRLDEINRGSAVPSFFGDFETAHAVLNISLAIQTAIAVRMAGFSGLGAVFTEGGFRRNEGYNTVLAALHPNARVSCTQLQEATALGAALLGRAALDTVTPMECADLFSIDEKIVDTLTFAGIEAYQQTFLAMLTKPGSGSKGKD